MQLKPSAMMVAAAALVTAASLLLPWLSSFWPVAVSQATAHAAGVVFGPALAAVALGIVGHRACAIEDDATLEELRAEIIKHLGILIEGGLVNVEALLAKKRRTAN